MYLLLTFAKLSTTGKINSKQCHNAIHDLIQSSKGVSSMLSRGVAYKKLVGLFFRKTTGTFLNKLVLMLTVICAAFGAT